MDNEDRELQRALDRSGVAARLVTPGVLRQVAGVSHPVSWRAVAPAPVELGADAPWGQFTVVCDRVSDPGNSRTIARTAVALGVDDLALTDRTRISARGVRSRRRAALVLAIRVRRFASPVDAVDSLRSTGFQIVATSPRNQRAGDSGARG